MRDPSWWGDAQVAHRVVLVAVGDLDPRAIAAVTYARELPAHQHAAMHVVTDADQSASLGLQWMGSALHRLPLHLVDDIGGVSATLREAVEHTLDAGADEVVVVAGRSNPTVTGRLFHAHNAERIHDALLDIERVRVALVAV
jgi:hypothetical protein